MNSTPSWNQIYAAGTADPVKKQDSLSNLAFRELLSKSAAPIGSSAQTSKYSGKGTKPEQNGFEKFLDTPVIKQVIDALSVGTYATANTADQALTGAEKVKDGDLSGFLDIASSPVVGVAKGLSAATGNDNDKKTFSDVIKHGQDMAGLDSENTAAKIVQGVGGFVGDVALDPTTYLSFGGTALAKGAVKGFVEGGKGAARKAAEGARTASEAGVALSGRAAEINSAADKAGIMNRFKEAGVQAKGEYKDWMAQNGGKIVNWEIPFKGSKNPKDAEAIADQTLSRSRREGLNDLVPEVPVTAAAKAEPVKQQLALEQLPFTAGADGVQAPGRFNSPVPEKTPEVLAEEQAIAGGIKEATKSDIPIIDPEVKAPKAKTAEEITADAVHENMSEIMNTVKFSKPAYGSDVHVIYSEAHKASVPKTVKKAAPAGTPTKGGINGLAMIDDLKANALKEDAERILFKRPGTTTQPTLVHPSAIVKYLKAATTPQQKTAVLRGIDPSYQEKFRKVIDAPVEDDIVEEIAGVPIDYSHPSLAKLKAEHRDLDPQDLLNVRSATRDKRDIARYIANEATPDELALMGEKLGLASGAMREDIKRAFMKRYDEWRDRSARELKEAAAPKPKPETAREAVGTPNQETAQLIEKVPLEQTLIRRANRAIQADADMKLPLTKTGSTARGTVFRTDLVDMHDVEKLGDNALQRGMEVQSGIARKYRTATGAKTQTPDKNTGNYIFPDKWGTMSAIAMHDQLVQDIVKIGSSYATKAKDIDGAAKLMPVFNKMELYRRGMTAAMTKLRAMGVAPYLDLGRGAKDTHHVNLGYDDIADILFTDMATRTFAGAKKQIQPQAFATGVEALIRAKMANKNVDDVAEDIFHAFVGDSKIYRGKYKDAEGIIRGIDKTRIQENIKGVDEDGVLKKFGMEAAIEAYKKAGMPGAEARKAYLDDMKSLAEKWAKDDDLYVNLNNRMIVNAREHAAEIGKIVDSVSEETAAAIEALALKGFSPGDFEKLMKETIKRGKAALGEADETKYLLWETEMTKLRDKIKSKGEQKATQVAEKVSKIAAETPAVKRVDPVSGKTIHVKTDAVLKTRVRAEEAIKVENMKAVDSSMDDAKAIQDELTPDEIYDVYSGAISLDTMRRIHPISSFFSTKFGLDASGMRGAIGTGLHTQVRMQSIFHGGVMNYLAKNPEKLMDDWKTIQNEGLIHNGGPFQPSTQSAQELYKVINMIFDVSDDNIITRNGLGARHWNAAAKSKGLKLELDDEKSMLENSKAWLSHEGLDSSEKILEFLSKAHAVSTNLASDIAIASNFARTFGSATPKDGYALLNWSKRGFTKSKTASVGEKDYGFYDLLPKSVYYNKEAIADIANIHRTLNEARAIKPEGPLGSFMVNVFNPVTNILKASQTVVRPGHWVNNVLGDTMRNYLAGVTTITPYRHTVAMMKANGKEMKILGENPLNAYEWHKNTTTGQYKIHGNGAGVVVNIGGKPQKISYESLYRLMQDGPIMPKHHSGGVAEDFLAGDTTGMNSFGKTLNSIQDKVLDNEKFSINSLAATRDNFGRIPLAIDFAMKGKFKDIHELKAGMEEQVFKWAPTSTDFTAKEAKYVRPAFMYYTWLRGITPRIVDTLMNKPGVALAPSKALYNVAVANGIDPISFGNPFPPEAQVPSYFHDGVIGPLMHGEGPSMWGYNIANPVTDVMNTLGKGITPGGMTDGSNLGSMAKTVLGSASPFAKIPVDLATGQSNGVPITDTNQYLQDALTGSWGGLISKSTGTLWNGEGRTDTSNGPMHGVDQSEVAKLQIANFLSGLKITDYQSPSALRSFMGEAKNNLNELKMDYRRNI